MRAPQACGQGQTEAPISNSSTDKATRYSTEPLKRKPSEDRRGPACPAQWGMRSRCARGGCKFFMTPHHERSIQSDSLCSLARPDRSQAQGLTHGTSELYAWQPRRRTGKSEANPWACTWGHICSTTPDEGGRCGNPTMGSNLNHQV